MHRQVGDLCTTPDGLACRGLLVRHLVMPGQTDESREIFRWLADAISPDTYVNIMGQYRLAHEVGSIAATSRPTAAPRYEEINRSPHASEMQAAYRAAGNASLWRFDKRLPRFI